MSNPNPPAPAGRRSGALFRLGSCMLAVYAFFLGWNFSPVAGGADSSGYLNSARLLAAGKFAAAPRVPPELGQTENLSPQLFQPHGFVPFPDNPGLSPTYPAGLPLHLALAGKLCGWPAAPHVAGLGAAAAALLLTFGVARRLDLPPVLAATGAVILALYPVFLFTSLQPLSDTLATVWCLAAVGAALRAREHTAWAAACGAALAVAVLVRATNLLLLPALLVLLGASWRRLGPALLGGLPGALWLGYYQHALYGSAFRSGYVDITAAFGWDHGWPTTVHFARWLVLMLPAPLLLLPWCAAWRPDGRTRTLAALALWFGCFAAFYVFYAISHEVWWNLRFLLPGTPALILAGLLGLESFARARPAAIARRVRAWSALALALWAAGSGVYWTRHFHVLLTKSYEQAYADAAAAAREHFPAGTLVVAGLHTGALIYYTDLPVLRWEFARPDLFARIRNLTAQAGRPIAAVVHKVEESDALQKNCPGPWTRVAVVRDFSLWRLDAVAVAPPP